VQVTGIVETFWFLKKRQMIEMNASHQDELEHVAHPNTRKYVELK